MGSPTVGESRATRGLDSPTTARLKLTSRAVRAGSESRRFGVTTTAISSKWTSVNVDCADSAGLADFWGKVLGRPVSPGKTPGVMVVGEPDPAELQMVFAQVTEEGKGTGGFQPNLITDHHDQEIERLVGLGAKVISEVNFPQIRLTQLADPEGNLLNLATWHQE